MVLRVRRFGVVLLGAALVTAWDLALDPAMTTGFPSWVWDQPGGYYGIPARNFAAWFLTAGAIIALYLALRLEWRPNISRLPVFLYALQSAFPAVLAALYDRPGATVAWGATMAIIGVWGLLRWRRISDRPDACLERNS
jgi:putative membrane protein